ncbi:MAG: GNAT family N-acetyltransferase [bacterium]|nr:GNAT family N-acetyltransferase [bacterium]
MKLEKIKDAENWNHFTGEFTKSLFYKFEWYDVFKTLWKTNLLARLENCFLPLQLNTITRTAYSGPWGSYGGPVGDKNLAEAVLKQAKRALFLRKIFIYSEKELNISNLNFSLEKNYSVVVTLDDVESIKKRLHENRKRNLKKALEGNLYFEIARGEEGARRYIKLLGRVLKERKGYKFHEISLFKKLGKLKEAFFCFAGKEKDESAALIIESDTDTILYWHGVNSKEALQLHIGDFLHWSIIEWGLKRGFKFYNLGTSPHGELLNYKLSWGGERKIIYTYVI